MLGSTEVLGAGRDAGNSDCIGRMDVFIGISIAAIRAEMLGECEGGGISGACADTGVRSGVEDSASALDRGEERYIGGGVSVLRLKLEINANGPGGVAGGVVGATATAVVAAAV